MRTLVCLLRRSFLAILLIGACLQPAVVHAASCSGWASSQLFGTVDLLAGGVTDSSSTISFGCSANPGERVLLCFSMGADPGTGLYDPRNLANSASRMAFNLYTDASRTTIWGSTASTSYRPVPFILDMGSEYYETGKLDVYGRIDTTGQGGLPAGTYSTNDFGGWPMTIKFKTIPSGATPDCSGGGMQSNSSNYYISAVVNSDCRLGTVTSMDFGRAFGTISSNIDSTSNITLTCNGGQGTNGYRVQLGNGANASGSQRRMKGAAGYIQYELYQDPARSIRWGNYNGVDKTGVGNGQAQTLTVYGRVPPQTAPGPGLFTDTVVVTLVY